MIKRALAVFARLVFTLLAGFLIFAAFYHVNEIALLPGGYLNVKNVISVKNYPSVNTGEVNLLYVSQTDNLTLFDYLVDNFRYDVSFYPYQDVASTPTGILPASAQQAQAIWQQKLSQQFAVGAALSALNIKFGYAAPGALVGWVDPTAPAGHVLKPGDTILRIDNMVINDFSDLEPMLSKLKPNSKHSLEFSHDGEVETKYLTLAKQLGSSGEIPYLGVGLLPNYQFPIQVSFNTLIDGGPLGGPSAGLAYSLYIANVLKHGMLIKGKDIAATGTIDQNGDVGPIGGLRQKVVGAINSGAKIFFVPVGQDKSSYDAIKAIARGKMKIYIVSSLSQVLSILLNLSRIG